MTITRHAPVNEHDDGPPGEFEIMSRAMQEILEEKGVITAEQIRQRMEQFEEDFPYRGSRVVARAWTDPAVQAAAARRRQGGVRRIRASTSKSSG